MKLMNTIALAAASLLLFSCGDDHYAQIRAGNQALRECPDWSSNPVSNYSNDDFSNLGCANTNNNYVQLKDKNDVTRGTGNVKIDAVRDSTILQTYINGSSPASASATTSSASSSSR